MIFETLLQVLQSYQA